MLSKFIGLFVFYFGMALNFMVPHSMWELWFLPIPILGMALYFRAVIKAENDRREREEDRLDIEADPETGRYH